MTVAARQCEDGLLLADGEEHDAPVALTRALEVHYPPKVVLALPDIALHAGEELAVVGPSGSGKTTLLHVLAGLVSPTKGTVRILGQELTGMTAAGLERFRARHVGLVFQDFHLIDGYTALENVMVSLAAAGTPLGAARAYSRALLEDLELGHRLHHLPRRLSAGERQRVAIARAVATDPVLLLADEPTANLDRGRAQGALELLRDIARRQEAALLIATHDPMVMDRIIKHVTLE